MLRSRFFRVAIVFSMATGMGPSVDAFDWLTLPGNYSHDVTGKRVAQYQPKDASPITDAGNFSRSGFRHTRSTLQYDQAADNFHVVERWGAPIEPYEQWRFPFRPYSSPYQAWGPPFAGLGHSGFGGGYGGTFGQQGFGQGIGPTQPVPGGVQGQYPVAPYVDGSYPSYPIQQRLNDRQFYAAPQQP